AWGAGALAAEALNSGRASGNSLIGPVEFERIGSDGDAVVLAMVAAQPDRSQSPVSEIRMDEVASPIEPEARESAAPVDAAERAVEVASESEPQTEPVQPATAEIRRGA